MRLACIRQEACVVAADSPHAALRPGTHFAEKRSMDDQDKSTGHSNDEDRHQEIAEIASHVYEVREGKEGDAVEDWLKAEAILERRDRAAATEQPLVQHPKPEEPNP